MRRLRHCFALALVRAAAVECFQPPVHHRRPLMPTSQRTRRDLPHSSIVAALRAASIDETELKAKLSEYLKKREEANADEAAKA